MRHWFRSQSARGWMPRNDTSCGRSVPVADRNKAKIPGSMSPSATSASNGRPSPASAVSSPVESVARGDLAIRISDNCMADLFLGIPRTWPSGMMLLVPMHGPVEVLTGCFVDRRRGGREVRRDVVLEAVFADVAKQRLHVRDLHHAGPAEGVQRVVGERALADVAANYAGEIVSREARKAHGAGLHRAVERAVGVLLANGARDDELIVHLHAFFEKMLRQVRAVEAHRLIWVLAVVVVPIEQRRGRLAGKRQRVHRERAKHVNLTRGWNEILAHHRHHGAGDDPQKLLD